MVQNKSTTENSTHLVIKKTKCAIGGFGHLGVFIWGLVFLLGFTSWISLWLMVAVLVVSALLYPATLRRVFHPRVLFMVFVIGITVYVFSDSTDQLARWMTVIQITLRAIGVVMLANGVASAMEITEIAALFERIGLKGLGFSLGVAINLLPALSESARNAWRSLKMRGGFRHRRWRTLELFLVTVVSNALCRAEDIALAAEARAFDPRQARRLIISRGQLDWVPWLAGPVILMMYMIIANFISVM